ncbi:hypothetical protein QBC47DRAFT_365790 [Echria macrotheca]|uniref:Uncharacterized protein n=1 Tax=Echria macrotheca TaxID=438768 RepID=A0AAJ0B4B2_9PEZI|nr:hypothetical protein QBC47DRAFT_365790 [Echria macrotheca]
MGRKTGKNKRSGPKSNPNDRALICRQVLNFCDHIRTWPEDDENRAKVLTLVDSLPGGLLAFCQKHAKEQLADGETIWPASWEADKNGTFNIVYFKNKLKSVEEWMDEWDTNNTDARAKGFEEAAEQPIDSFAEDLGLKGKQVEVDDTPDAPTATPEVPPYRPPDAGLTPQNITSPPETTSTNLPARGGMGSRTQFKDGAHGSKAHQNASSSRSAGHQGGAEAVVPGPASPPAQARFDLTNLVSLRNLKLGFGGTSPASSPVTLSQRQSLPAKHVSTAQNSAGPSKNDCLPGTFPEEKEHVGSCEKPSDEWWAWYRAHHRKEVHEKRRHRQTNEK